jgi:hypothetical protein
MLLFQRSFDGVVFHAAQLIQSDAALAARSASF